MDFSAAYIYLKRGHDIKLPEWGGYWHWDTENKTIMMVCRNGNVLDIRETKDVDYTMSFICRNDWILVESEEKHD